MTFPSRLRWLALTLAVVFLDRASKAWIESRPFVYFPRIVLPNYFTIIRSHNTGVAFSIFANTSSATRVILIFGSLLIIAIIAWLLVSARHSTAFNAAGLALLLGGATGNLTDRILHGAVTDFLQVSLPFIPLQILNPWPTFNVADAAVTLGAALLLIDVLFHPQPQSNRSH